MYSRIIRSFHYAESAVTTAIAAWFLLTATSVRGQMADSPPVSPPALTNIAQIWEIPANQRTNEFRIRTEMVIYFIDPEWGNASGECMGTQRWLPIFDSPYPLMAGERIAIDGVIVPQRERFVWNKTHVTILQKDVPLHAETVTNLSGNPNGLSDHLISVEGLIDSKLDEETHCTMTFLCGNVMAHVYVLKGANQSVPFKSGDFVRMRCVYEPQFDRDGNLSEIDLWVGRLEDIQVTGSLATDPRFDIPIMPIQNIELDIPTGEVVRVEGVVRKNEPGQSVTIWDATGQVTVDSKQTQPLQLGERVEAIGYPYVEGVQQTLRTGVYRAEPVTNTTAFALMATPQDLPLCLAEEVRDLSPEDAARHLPVHLRAVVTWSHTNTPFAYVQDSSGGVRVMNPRWDEPDTAKPGTIVILDGVTSDGDFVPVVTNAVLHRDGWANMEDGEPVTVQQAMTGVEEGQWVEMRGFVRNVQLMSGLARFELSTLNGEFQMWVPATESFESEAGSIIQVSGVCSVIANERHQLTGIQIWTPDRKYIQIEEPAPPDVFALPLRPLASLRRFNTESALNQRVHTSGIVVLNVPGQFVYVQDGADSIFALSQQTNALRPGDRVEVVGFPDQEGQKFVLREAVYRQISGGPEPDAVALSATNPVNANLEGLLVKTEGVLLSQMEKEGETRLLIRSKDYTFEASLKTAAHDGRDTPNFEPGSRVALTGVYETQSDEYGKPRSFLLHLRSLNDVQMLQHAPWWNLSRLLGVLVGVCAIFVIALTWGVLIARKNAMLNHARAALQEANDQLETRVAQRTQELEERVTAEEQARTELARAQRDLMLASRQAGMAEVATGVLHNVGNVLNSINISTTVLREQTHQSQAQTLQKVADLLQQKNDQLANFLTTDPRGKMVPGFIGQVADQLKKDKETAARELEQLAKNVDHIKAVVSMQQSYAKVAHVVEQTSLVDLVEDAIQINLTDLTRHGIKIIRRFEALPSIKVDKHKVLQILVNFIRNARFALDEGTEAERQLTITIAKDGAEHAKIQVHDNGVGIAPEHLTRIFSHGFTTRPNGHGFGLHLGAFSAREMGGSLNAASDGVGRGATFTLILPLNPPSPDQGKF
jgi:two-component system, cell cycle sensor histidine kinase and response regulator CckA